jgi:hypothetical protein
MEANDVYSRSLTLEISCSNALKGVWVALKVLCTPAQGCSNH